MKKVKNLLRHFGNIQKIRNASPDELKKVKKITSKDAKDIYNHFHSAQINNGNK